MRVILLKDVPKLGKRGEVKNVSGGYMRNYLMPHGFAVLADEGALRKTVGEQIALRSKEEKGQAALRELAEKLKKIPLSATLKIGERGSSFGSVGASKIAELLKNKGIVLDTSAIELEKPIKTLGEHKIKIKLDHGLEPELTLKVEKE